MTEPEMKQYMKELIQKYDYYDPIKDRIEALKFAKVKNKNLLDIGTGKGHTAILAAKNFNCKVMFIDIFQDTMKIAKGNAQKEKIDEKIVFKVADAAKLPFSKESFDIAISFNALHHSKGKFREIISEMFRVSKNKIVITELNENGVKIFDEYVHPEECHKSLAINLNELYDFLKKQSKVEKLERRLMTTYVCEKNKRRKIK